MKRTPLRRKTPLRQHRAGGPDIEREPKPMALQLASIRPLVRGTYSGGTSAPVPKPVEHRNPHLLSMANGMPCLLLVPGICNHRQDTTVSCHSNLSIHGKAGARKADDQYTVWGCAACHEWLDRGKAPAALKEKTFMEAHARQVLAWRGIAQFDPFLKDKRAAQWALDLLNATPTGEPE